MSQAEVEFVRCLYERLTRDMAAPVEDAALAELFAPDVELDLSRRVLNPGVYRGYDGMRQARSELRQVWDQWLLEPERLVDAGDGVVVVETVRARGRGSGVEMSMRSASRYIVRDGRVAHVIIYFDVAEAFADAGLRG